MLPKESNTIDKPDHQWDLNKGIDYYDAAPIFSNKPNNFTNNSRFGNAKWQFPRPVSDNHFIIDKHGAQNYLYIPQPQQGGISYGMFRYISGPGNFYIISDGYSGCEYHVLCHKKLCLIAVLHVYRANGRTTAYTLQPGWELVHKIESIGLTQEGTIGMFGMSCIWRSDPGRPLIESAMFGVNRQKLIDGVHNGKVSQL